MPRRELTPRESTILEIIQEGYGPQNTIDQVFFMSTGDAAIFVKAPDGTSPLVANLTNLAKWRSDGTIPNDDELRREWLRLT